METNSDCLVIFNLIACYFAIGDVLKMKQSFQLLVSTKSFHDSSIQIARIDDYIKSASILLATTEGYIGFEWVINILSSSEYSYLLTEVENLKLMKCLEFGEFDVIETRLQIASLDDERITRNGAINLASLHYLSQNTEIALKLVDIAAKVDNLHSNAKTLRGNIDFNRGKLDMAQNIFKEVAKDDTICFEAIFNLGLVLQQSGYFSESLNCFKRLFKMTNTNPDVIYQISQT